ncbi:zinc-dependent metalloprotease [Flavobacterium sp.]|uniref:zinc-dependent metalloprotease n=1 Tax=Flavobacterium sp. TaxID=239 RepID=UPI0037538B78
MKKSYYFIMLVLIFSSNLYSQKVLSFNNSSNSKINLSKNFKNYKILKLDNEMQKISNGESITINYLKNYSFTLKENKIISDNYILSLKTENGLERKSIQDINFDGKYYTNQDFSKDNQFVFSTFENTISIYIKNSNSEFYIESLSRFDKKAKSDEYVFYNAKDIISENLDCGNPNIDSNKIQNSDISNKNNLIGGCKTVELAISMDYNFYNTYNSVNASIDRTLQLLNLTQANFTIANGLSDNVQFLVTEHYIVTCPAMCNYWLPTLEIYDNYNAFSSNASKIFVNSYDIKVHFQPQGGTGSIIGLGSYVMCGTSGTAVVKNYANDTNLTRCILSHELGHNFGCVHNTDIMAAIISLSNNWSGTSITSINNSLNTLSCISNCSATICDNKKVVDANVVVDNTNNKINVSWLAEIGIDFKVRLYNNSNNTWSGYTTFSYPANSTFYNFTPVYCMDNYRVEITPFCGTIKGISEQIAVQTSKTVAAPTLSFNYLPTTAFCGSRTQTFSVTAIDGGTSPVYEWKLNGSVVGTNLPNYSSNTFLNNDVLSCKLTSNASCVATPNATVSTILNVVTPTVLSNSIAVTQSIICAGTSVTFTATGTNVVGANPYYAWYLNGQPYNGGTGGPGGQGGGGPVLTLIPAADGDVFTCVLYDSQGCHFPTSGGLGGSEGATSNSIAITIQNPCTLANSEFDVSDVAYYPNPVANELNIIQKEQISEVSFYSVLGQKVLIKQINSNKALIDVSSLSSGTYFIKIDSEGTNRNIKIIKE